MSPGLKSTNLYGPVPTGLRFAGASRDLAPLNGSNRCLGRLMPRKPQKPSAQNGVGFLNTSFTVWLSSLSIRAMSLYELIVVAAVAESAAYSQLKTMSSAVNGLPSCHTTPFLSLHVTDLPSLATAPFWLDGISAARIGTRLPSGSKAADGA